MNKRFNKTFELLLDTEKGVLQLNGLFVDTMVYLYDDHGNLQAKEQCPQQSLMMQLRHYKIFCVNVKYGIQYGFRIFYLIALQNEENYEREESCSA